MPSEHPGRLHENPILQITVIFAVETLRNVQIQDFYKNIPYDWRCNLCSVRNAVSHRVNDVRVPESKGEFFVHFKA